MLFADWITVPPSVASPPIVIEPSAFLITFTPSTVTFSPKILLISAFELVAVAFDPLATPASLGDDTFSGNIKSPSTKYKLPGSPSSCKIVLASFTPGISITILSLPS